MNLLTILQKERSKKTNIEVANYIGNNKERFAELIEIITGKDLEMANRPSTSTNDNCRRGSLQWLNG